MQTRKSTNSFLFRPKIRTCWVNPDVSINKGIKYEANAQCYKQAHSCISIKPAKNLIVWCEELRADYAATPQREAPNTLSLDEKVKAYTGPVWGVLTIPAARSAIWNTTEKEYSCKTSHLGAVFFIWARPRSVFTISIQFLLMYSMVRVRAP